MSSLSSKLPRYIKTKRLTLVHFDRSAEHYQCLLDSMNNATAYANMGDFGITQPNQFDDATLPNRLKLSAFPSGFIDEVDVASYYVVKLDDGPHAGQLIGGVSLSHRGDRVPVDIGWCFREEFHGNGYATEAALALKDLALDTLHIKHLVALPACKNEASKAVARKIGLVEGCVLEEPDRSLPSCVYYLPGTPISPHMMDKVPKENLRDFKPATSS